MTAVRVRGLVLPEREPYLTRGELAALMGVSVRSIDRMIADGMPCERWGMRSVRFKASTAIAWARGRGHNDVGTSPA